MSGFFYFGGENGIALSTTQSRLLGELIRPAIQKVSAEVIKKVYFSYDLYDNTLDFSDLTQEEYMNCYNHLKHLCEIDLIEKKDEKDERGIPYQDYIDFWYDEMKIKMKNSPLFNPKFL